MQPFLNMYFVASTKLDLLYNVMGYSFNPTLTGPRASLSANISFSNTIITDNTNIIFYLYPYYIPTSAYLQIKINNYSTNQNLLDSVSVGSLTCLALSQSMNQLGTMNCSYNQDSNGNKLLIINNIVNQNFINTNMTIDAF